MIIKKGNIYSEIIETTSEEYEQFRGLLSFHPKNYYFNAKFKAGFWDGYIRLFRKKSFPTGLLELVKSGIDNVSVIERKPRLSLEELSFDILNTKKMSGKYSYQLDVVRQALLKQRGVINLGTGAGKTVIAAAIIKFLNVPTLFIVPTIDLLNQTQEVFEKEIGGEIGSWGGGEENLQKITVALPKTILNRISKKDYKEFIENCKCLFVDECHYASADTYQDVLKACKDAIFRYGLSATPFCKSQLKNVQVQAYLGEEICKITNDDLIKLQTNSTPKVIFYRSMSLIGSEDYLEIYDVGIINNSYRNSVIVSLVNSLLENPEEIVLILVLKIRHGEVLQELFREKGREVLFVHGSSDKEVRKQALSSLQEGNSRVLIISRIGELGIDIPQLNSLVYGGGEKTTVGALQRIGRLLRNPTEGENYVYFYDFMDMGNKYLEEHSRLRFEQYEKEGFETKVIDYK